MERERDGNILQGFVEFLGEGLFEFDFMWWIAVAAIGVLIVFGMGYAIYQIATDSQFVTASLGTDLASYFDSISINPDKWV